MSPEGKEDRCTLAQIEQHRETKMSVMEGLNTALRKGGIEKERVEMEMNKMRLDTGGGEASLPIPINESKNAIKSIGERIGINCMSRRKAIVPLQLSSDAVKREMYEECLEKIERRVTRRSSADGSEYADSTFL